MSGIQEKESFITTELKKFNITDASISELSQKYLPLSINGLEDKEGYKTVKAARIIVKNYRVDVDKRRKELNADALEYQRRINGEAKRITALLEPIENHLSAQEKKIDDEIENIKIKKQQEEEYKFQDRINSIIKLKFTIDQGIFKVQYDHMMISISTFDIKQWDDEKFNLFLSETTKIHDEYQTNYEQIVLREREAEEKAKADLKAAEELLDKQRKEFEEERAKFERDRALNAPPAIEEKLVEPEKYIEIDPEIENKVLTFDFRIESKNIKSKYKFLNNDQVEKVLIIVNERMQDAIDKCIDLAVHECTLQLEKP